MADTHLLISADVKRSTRDFQSGRLKAESLQGTLTDGRRISATDLGIKEVQGTTFGNKTRFVVYSLYWTISGPSVDGQATVVFELVNFCYFGTEVETQMVNGFEHSARSLMTLEVGERLVQLRRITDYDQAVAALKAGRGVQVTCTASTTIDSQSEIDAVVSTMDTLCDIMSVARGTLVSWTSFEVHAADEVSPYSRYRNSVIRHYTDIELITSEDCLDTKRFIEEGFRKCEELDNDFQVRKIARAFTETRGGPFSESRSLLIAVLVEYLASVRARIQGHSRRTLKWKLGNLATWLEIGFTPDEIDKFVKTRNMLAHESRYPDNGTPEEHYQRMQHFLDRIILRLFDYRGPYYDFEHFGMRQL